MFYSRTRTGFILIVLLTASLVLLACTDETTGLNQAKDPALPTAQQKDTPAQTNTPTPDKTIHLVTLQYPPYEYADGDEIDGIAVRIVEEAFSRMEYDIRIELLPWARALSMVKSGEADGVFTAYKTPAREAFADYSAEVLLPQIVALFVRHDADIDYTGNLRDLSDYTFGTVTQVSYGPQFDSLVEEGILRVDTVDTGEDNIEKLLSGRVDIIASNRLGALHILQQRGDLELVRELSPALQSIPSYLAFSKANDLTDVRDDFDRVLREMRRDGTIQEIIDGFIE